jgi:hypothetical protein
LNMERAGARSRPSVMPRLRCLRSMEKDYNNTIDGADIELGNLRTSSIHKRPLAKS